MPQTQTVEVERSASTAEARPELLAGQEGRLIVQGTDRPGIVAAVSAVLAHAGANIVSLDQYSAPPGDGRFFQRTSSASLTSA